MEFNGKKMTAFGMIEAEWSGEMNALAAQLQDHKDDTNNPHEITPQMVGAVPAEDFVVDRGTDGDWTWEKRQSGVAVCYALSDFGDIDVDNSWQSGWYESEKLNKDFPAGLFIDIPILQINVVKANGAAFVSQYLADITAANTGTFTLSRPSSMTVKGVHLGFYAVGRWKEEDSDGAEQTAYVGGTAATGAVLYTPQELTEEQKSQARKNIGAEKAKPVQYATAYGNPLQVNVAGNREVAELAFDLQNDGGFDAVEIEVCGKNLLDKTKYANGNVASPKMYYMYPVSTYGENRMVYMPIIDGETYTISQGVFGTYARYALVDNVFTDKYDNTVPTYQPPLVADNGEIAGYVTFSAAAPSRTFVNKYNRKYLIAWIYSASKDTLTYDEIANSIQVELGAQATDWEAYRGSTYTIPIGESVTAGTLEAIGGTFTKADGTTISTEKAAISFAAGDNVVMATNATSIFAKYAEEGGADTDNPLYGKKIVAIGDSMVYGHTLAADKTWLALIAERNGMTYVNYGSNGRYMTHNPRGDDNRYDGVCDVFQNMVNDADYVIVFAGTNDIQQNFAIGDENSTNTAEFYGALNAITDGLQAKYPTAKIAFITPYARAGLLERSKQFRDAICTACERGGIPVFDNIKNGGINWNVAAQMTAYTLNDTYHLNAAGMDMASRKYERFLKQI